jgi:hypothetical protein
LDLSGLARPFDVAAHVVAPQFPLSFETSLVMAEVLFLTR